MLHFNSIEWYKRAGTGWIAVVASDLKQRQKLKPYISVFIDDKKYIVTAIEVSSGNYLGTKNLGLVIRGEK